MNEQAIKEIRNREAALHNCEGLDKLREAANAIWGTNINMPIGGENKFYFTSIIDKGYFNSSTNNLGMKSYTPSEVLGEVEQVISLDKKYRTRNGKDTRVYAVDAGGHQPIHGAILEDEEWVIEEWGKHGEYRFDGKYSNLDLIEVLQQEEPTKEELLEEAKRRFKGNPIVDCACCYQSNIGEINSSTIKKCDNGIIVEADFEGVINDIFLFHKKSNKWATIVEVKKEESKLEKAKKLYAGDPVVRFGDYKCKIISETIHEDLGSIWAKDSVDGNFRYVFSDQLNRWAEIVKEPKKLSQEVQLQINALRNEISRAQEVINRLENGEI